MGNAEDAGQRTRVRPARDEDVPALVEVMVAAFADDPVHHWLYPDARTRPDVHRRLFAFLLRCGLRHGGVWTDTGLRGMALWVAPGEQEMTDDETDVYLRMRREDMGERAGPVGEALWAIGASAPRGAVRAPRLPGCPPRPPGPGPWHGPGDPSAGSM